MNKKTVRMSYCFYKKFFSECEIEQNSYCEKNKTISVIIPIIDEKIPKTWKKDGQSLIPSRGVVVRVYGSGVSRSFVVECNYWSISKYKTKTINPGVNSIKNLIETVKEFEKCVCGTPI